LARPRRSRKESVRIENRFVPATVFIPAMATERSLETDDIVYLLVETVANGRIHEIGTRGIVLTVTAAAATVELGGSSGTVTCPTTHVEHAAEHRTRARGTRRADAWLRPAA